MLAETRATPCALQTLQHDEMAWAITSDVEPAQPVELTIPYDPAKVVNGSRPLVVTFDELTGLWLPVETSVDPDAERLTAILPSFSPKTWITDRVEDIGGTASWLEYQLWKVFDNRAAKPDCSTNPKPAWVVEVITNPDDNAQLFACVGRDGDGFAVHVVNNRGYPVGLEVDRPFTSARPTILDDGLSGLAAHLMAATGQTRVPLAPTGSATVSYDPVNERDGFLQGHVRRDTRALLMFITLERLARQTGTDLPLLGGKELGLWTLDCYLRQFTATGQLITSDGVAAANQLLGCFEDTLLHEVRLWGFDPEGNFGQRLWSSEATGLPTGARNMVKVLRMIRYRPMDADRCRSIRHRQQRRGRPRRLRRSMATGAQVGCRR